MKSPRPITPEDAARLVMSGMWLDYGFSHAQPDAFDAALAARKVELSNVSIRSCLTLRPRQVLEQDPAGAHFAWYSEHFSGYDRSWHDRGRCTYIPVNLGETADYYRRFMPPVDILVLRARPPDEHGFFNFGTTNTWHGAIAERARCVIIETNPSLPYALPRENGLHESQVDFVIDGTALPPAELNNPPPGEIDRAVARFVSAEVEDGACLQIGIGGMANAVCSLLLEAGQRDLGVHTEMLVDGLADLYHAGRITGARKALDPGKIIYTFAVGAARLYETMHRNVDFHCVPAEYTNMPHIIMRNPGAVSINNVACIDLQGQACSESDGHRHLTGTGGQLQFVRGAYASPGGKSFLCLSSTYERNGVRRSRITAALPPGAIVTTPRTDVMYVVTEWGMVNLKGKSVTDRVRAMIGLAHPDFREDLSRQAREAGLLPRITSLALSGQEALAPACNPPGPGAGVPKASEK